MKQIYSPDRRYVVDLETFEMRMSHWISVPCVRDNATGQPVLDLSQTLWHADDVRWDDTGAQVILNLRHYPGDRPGIVLIIDLTERSCTIKTASETLQMGVEHVAPWLEAYANGENGGRQ
jgi:hypothetical protein